MTVSAAVSDVTFLVCCRQHPSAYHDNTNTTNQSIESHLYGVTCCRKITGAQIYKHNAHLLKKQAEL